MKWNIEPALFGVVPSPEFPGLVFSRFEIPEFQLVLADLLEFDCIIYTAGAGIQSDLRESLEITYELNSFLPVKIFNFLTAENFKGKIITFGSYFEIGNEPAKRFYTENEVALSGHPVPNHYASSKRILTRYLNSAPGLPDHYHLILPNIYGKGESANRLIPYIINSVKQGTEIKLTSGSQVRQYIHASDNARVVLMIVKNEYPKGLYNVCNIEPVQIRTLVGTIFKVLDRDADFNKIKFGMDQRTDTFMPFLLLDNEKAKTILSFSTTLSLEEGINSYL